MLQLRLKEHLLFPGKGVVEVLQDGVVIATITASSDYYNTLRVITKHKHSVVEEPGPVTVIDIKFDL